MKRLVDLSRVPTSILGDNHDGQPWFLDMGITKEGLRWEGRGECWCYTQSVYPVLSICPLALYGERWWEREGWERGTWERHVPLAVRAGFLGRG